ncbi:hypothetical protein ACS0TY_022212 [Phlomoides rotata]
MLNLDVPDFKNLEKLIDNWVAFIKNAKNTLDYDKEIFIGFIKLSLTGSVKIGWEGVSVEVKDELTRGESKADMID